MKKPTKPEQVYAEYRAGKHISAIAFERRITKYRVKRIIREVGRREAAV